MSAKPGPKKTLKEEPPEDEQARGLWIDAALISRLHGRKSSPLAVAESYSAESTRLLHYADVILGTDKKEKFVSSKPTKHRKKLKTSSSTVTGISRVNFCHDL